MVANNARTYHYGTSQLGHHHAYLLPALSEILDTVPGKRVFDLGCGNGSVAAYLTRQGYYTVGVDPSEEGIRRGREEQPGLHIHVGSAYDDLAAQHGQFPIVISLEVVEHIYSPRHYAKTLYELVEPGGTAIISTPYHGYLKNLSLALTGRMEAHFTALWEHGHIKFWSISTLTTLLEGAGFRDLSFRRVGRVPPLAKSMIAVARK